MLRRAVLVFTLALCSLPPALLAAATETELERLGRLYRGAIATCVADVRNESGYQSKFDMYLTKMGELRGWGTDHEIYLFNKCMERRGYDTRAESRGPKAK